MTRLRLFGLCLAGFAASLSSTASATAIPKPDHVVIVIMENTNSTSLVGSSSAPYINSLIAKGANFTMSYGVTHPSQPNYLALFSGSQQGVTNDNCPQSFTKVDNLASQLIAAHLTFGAYSEDLAAIGDTSCTNKQYARKHDPWVDFDNVPSSTQMIYPDNWPKDFTQLPTVSFLVPNLCDDMHNCTVPVGDTWLKNNIDPYVTWAETHNSLLILTWDEDDMTAVNQIVTVFAGQIVKPGSYSEKITHYSILRTLEDMFGLTPLGNAAMATPITDVWMTASSGNPDMAGGNGGSGGSGGGGSGGSGGGGSGGSGGGGSGGSGGGGSGGSGGGGSGGSGGGGTGGNGVTGGNMHASGGCSVGGTTSVGAGALLLLALFALGLRRRRG